MKHVTYALFERETDLRAALDDVVASGVDSNECSVIRHASDLHADEIGHGESAAWSGFTRGAVLGGLLGALAGGVLLGSEGAPLAVGGATAIFGGFAGALGGAGQPEPFLERLTNHLATGNVLLIAATPSLETQSSVEILIRAHGGVIEAQHFPPHHDASKHVGGAS